MARADDYRKHAQDCEDLARTARTPAQRTMLLHIAETWSRLANEMDELAEVSENRTKKPRLM